MACSYNTSIEQVENEREQRWKGNIFLLSWWVLKGFPMTSPYFLPFVLIILSLSSQWWWQICLKCPLVVVTLQDSIHGVTQKTPKIKINIDTELQKVVQETYKRHSEDIHNTSRLTTHHSHGGVTSIRPKHVQESSIRFKRRSRDGPNSD